ncbi:MAG: hypothetical protein VW625_04100 [Perlucidibaca sp.]
MLVVGGVRPAGSSRVDPATPIDVPTRELQTLTWLSCEKVSHALTLDDPLQAELALGIMQARMACLDDIRWQDERPSGGENVSRLPGRHHNMK